MATRVLHLLKWLVASAVLLLAAGCSKPAADFSVNRQTFKPGDTVHMQNQSKGSEIFEWYLGEKLIGSAENLSYIVGSGETGVLTFKLKASAEGKDASVATKTVMVEATTGTVTVWSTFPGMEIVQVVADQSVPAGTTSNGFENEPGCAADGCVNLSLAPGTHTIDGISPITRTRRIVDVNIGECVVVKMH